MHYTFYTEFQSHEPEFDYLKSLEIEEKINSICWCKQRNAAHFLITTNDKTVKLWKVFEKAIKTTSDPSPSENEIEEDKDLSSYVKLPRFRLKKSVTTAVPKRIYQNAHAYHINSLSVNSDGETFISADDLRINLWNVDVSNQSFNIVDLKPKNMEELSEVITAAKFHPSLCNLFIFSSSKGTIRLNDMRQGALCDTYSKLFEMNEDPKNKSFFSEIISSISDIKFSFDGRYIVSRDYLTIKVWDVNMEKVPLKVIKVHEQLRPRLCELYENDLIFDKFECSSSSAGEQLLTGSYGNYFHILDIKENDDIILRADKGTFEMKESQTNNSDEIPSIDDIVFTDKDFGRKMLHNSWHPTENVIALAAMNNLFLFKA